MIQEFLQSQTKISFVEYSFLYFLFHKINLDLFGEISNESLNNLLNEGYLKNSDEGWLIREKGIKLFSKVITKITDEDFKTLFNLFPISTPGGRKLRPKNPEGFTYETLKQAFKKKIKEDKNLFNKTVLGLKRELASRSVKGNMEYMQLFSTWINKAGWEMYLDEEEQSFTFDEML